jgi:hypothetical protein
VAIAAYLYGVETHPTYKELELIGFVRPLGQYVSQHPNKKPTEDWRSQPHPNGLVKSLLKQSSINWRTFVITNIRKLFYISK